MPQWINAPYRQNVNEDTRNMTGIYTVVATDQDLQEEMIYEVTGIDPAPRYFAVGRTTRYIFVINNLRLDRGLTYTVC
jgi:hypothetical protein